MLLSFLTFCSKIGQADKKSWVLPLQCWREIQTRQNPSCVWEPYESPIFKASFRLYFLNYILLWQEHLTRYLPSSYIFKCTIQYCWLLIQYRKVSPSPRTFFNMSAGHFVYLLWINVFSCLQYIFKIGISFFIIVL